MVINLLFSWLQIKVRLKGLHKSLTPDPWPLTPALSTTVETPLQISPVYMQNKANFRKSQMNVTKVLTKDYEIKTLGEHGKNEPKTNPIKANACPPSVWRIRDKKMLMRLTINTRRNSPGSCPGQIEHGFSGLRIHVKRPKVPNY